MKRIGWIACLVLTVSLLGGGIFLATDGDAKVSDEAKAQAPGAEAPASTETAVDLNKQQFEDSSPAACRTYCPNRTCGGPNCSYTLGDAIDYGVRCCVYEGNVFTCSGNTTVHQWHNACGGQNCGNPGPDNYSAPYCQ